MDQRADTKHPAAPRSTANTGLPVWGGRGGRARRSLALVALAGSAAAIAVAAVWGCGGGTPVMGAASIKRTFSGRVLKGPVAEADVVALAVTPKGITTDELARVKTDTAGAFALEVANYQGPVLLVASGGQYVEEALGTSAPLGEGALVRLIPRGVRALSTAHLTPVSTVAFQLAKAKQAQGFGEAVTLEQALREVQVHLDLHLGQLPWETTTPADLTVRGPTPQSDEARAGLVLAGLSQLAASLAAARSQTAGVAVSSSLLTQALARDAADGTLDGVSPTSSRDADELISSNTLRGELAQAMATFLRSPRNASGLQVSDVTTMLSAIGRSADAYLFCRQVEPAPPCAPGVVDFVLPVVSFLAPGAGSGAAGVTAVEVRATDETRLRSLRLVAPERRELLEAAPVLDEGGRAARLSARLDVSSLPDGPLELVAEAVDSAGNVATARLGIVVANGAPRITVSAPSEGATVKGDSVLVSATASTSVPGAKVARLELVDAPVGVASDELPAADVFSAVWATSRAAEGTHVLRFRATDSLGTSSELSVPVVVDNHVPGRVTVVASAGSPVDGLTVKLVAVDPKTGLPWSGRPGGALLGQSTDVTVDGGVTFELAQENYDGPAQLVAEGAQARYVDPSDGASVIALPATFAMTSYVAHYRSGDNLERPITLWTTLSDAAVRAVLAGRNSALAGVGPVDAAVERVDGLFERHLGQLPWRLRTTMPASLTTAPETLRDVVIAAFPDVALNQQARDLAGEVGLTSGSAFSAPHLVDLLVQDIADGLFDGRADGAALTTAGTRPYTLDADTTRLRQALALDRFLRSEQNRTRLTRQDIQTSNVFDTMSFDRSPLYPAASSPTPFDSAPPEVSWGVTFENGARTAAVPVGAERVVGGRVSIVARTVDASGLASVTLSAGGARLAHAEGVEAALVQATLAPTAEGPLTVSARACDRLGNCAESVYAMKVDRTPPSVSVAQPSPGRFVSAAFDLDATARDANGLASLELVRPVGLVDVSAELERAFVPASRWRLDEPDGPLAIEWRACDLVGNCRVHALEGIAVDRTAPVVEVTSHVPQYTNFKALELVGTVSDGVGAGPRRVLVRRPGEAIPMAATIEGGFWRVEVPLGRTGDLTVWAEDAAEPPNDGALVGRSPHVVTRPIVTDYVAPIVVPGRAPSYYSEQGLSVALDDAGRPIMPVKYLYRGDKLVVEERGTVYKIASKAGALDDNVPKLFWNVSAETESASPIVSATYAVTTVGQTVCGRGPVTRCPTGELREVLAQQPGVRTFELAVSPDTLGYSGLVSFSLFFVDAAGNETRRDTSVNLVLIGAPLVLVPDGEYRKAGDSRSLHAVTPGRGYPTLMGAERRVLRWVLYNPNRERVLAHIERDVSEVTWSEHWGESVREAAPDERLSDLGQTWKARENWYSRLPSGDLVPTPDECTRRVQEDRHGIFPFPCPASTAIEPQEQPTHYLGEAQPYVRCERARSHFEGGFGGSHSLTHELRVAAGLEVMANPKPGGGEQEPAPLSSQGDKPRWIIPAATTVTPGTVAVYATVTLPFRGSGPGVTAAQFPVSGEREQRFVAGWTYRPDRPNTLRACTMCRGVLCVLGKGETYNQGWKAYFVERFLTNFKYSLKGGLQVSSNTETRPVADSTTTTLARVPFEAVRL